MVEIKDIYWLAGLLEGEGSFGYYQCAVLQLHMTDFDVVNRAQRLIDPIANIRTQIKKGPNNKVQYILHVNGANAIQWMMTLYPLMGERRKSKIKECITKWKQTAIVTRESTNPKKNLLNDIMKLGFTKEQALAKIETIN